MLFNLQEDRGGRVSVYVVPDSGGATPAIRVRAGGEDRLTLQASEAIPELVRAGRHATGLCGFVVDETILPGLAGFDDLEILEAGSGLPVYRRVPPGTVAEVSLFRLETHLLPLWRIDDALRHRFRYWYKGVDRHGRETSLQVFNLTDGSSSYVSGRLLYKNYEDRLNKGVRTVAALRDPYDELAERLILLKNVGARAEEVLGARDALVFAPAIAALADHEVLDETFCKRFFRRAGAEALAPFANPLVRQLTATTPDDTLNHASLATALDALSSFALIGLRGDGETFRGGLAELAGVPEAAVPAVVEYPRVTELGRCLRANSAVEVLLEKDLEIFHDLGLAFTAAETGATQP